MLQNLLELDAIVSRFNIWPFKERRASPRWRVALNVIYGVGDDMIATTSVDISETSISVFARKPLPIGTTVEIHLATSHNENWIAVKGTVNRAESGVMALEFVNFPKKEMAELGDYLRELQQVGRSELVEV